MNYFRNFFSVIFVPSGRSGVTRRSLFEMEKEKEENPAHLRPASLGIDVSRHRETGRQDLLCVVDRRLQQLFEVLILGQVLVTGFSPSCHSLWRKIQRQIKT